ncbi:transcription antitermination factor NusB [bacterium D16-51]|nr:transcription antitermination factor NusB [bacterium D16-59]RKI54927.1 transcription antitermination factor NusB [bacterium D16-51]
MTKKRTRENLYIMLFQMNFYQEEDRFEQAELYLEGLEDSDATGKAKSVLRERYQAVLGHISEIDQKIEEKAEGWALGRLPKSDLTILRLAVFEILFDEDVPNGVAINEAVELAKLYGGDKSYRFINGVLASIVKELEL